MAKLFLDDEIQKEAAFAGRLSETPENWPQELTSDLYKQLPFLSDYDMNVNLERVEAQRGYAFGYADVSNRTERPEQEHSDHGMPHLRIPLVVVERGVKPYSVFVDGERVMPLTEDRIREQLFNPETFDLSTSAPRDPSLIEATTPPTRSGMGMGGEIKTASIKTASLLMAIAPTIREGDAQRFINKLASDQGLLSTIRRHDMGDLMIEVFGKTKRASASDRLAALAESIEPTVMTFQKLPGGDFLVKSASAKAFKGDKKAKGEKVEKKDAEKAIGKKNADDMKPGQTATAVADPVTDPAAAGGPMGGVPGMPPAPVGPKGVNKAPKPGAQPQQPQQDPMAQQGQPQAPAQAPMDEPLNAKPCDQFGQYKVQDAVGNVLLGHVFPETLAWDGNFTPQPVMLFTNGSAYAVQDAIAGELVGKGTNLPKDAPRGDGVFYCVDGGEAVCTAPVSVGSVAAGPDGLPRFMATDLFGQPLQITQAEGLRTPQRISDTEFAIPENWKFMRLNNQTQLTSQAADVGMKKKASALKNSVEMFYNGAYHLRGGCGLNKIAADMREEMDHVHAEFMLGLLGVDGMTAKQKVAECRRKGSIKLAGLKTITTMAERYAQHEKTASAFVSKIPDLRVDLTKIAASMEDSGTVDKLLALNFVNPENLTTFVSYLPELQETSERLSEMLLSSYLGMQELPEFELDRSIKNIEQVIGGLKAVAATEQN